MSADISSTHEVTQRVGIALGSNLGNRTENLQSGFDFLRRLSLNGHFLSSSILATEPVDCPPGSNTFLNAVVEIEWSGTPLDLLNLLQNFEENLGRPKVRPVNSPRPLDLDLIYFGDLRLKTDRLILPHPRASQREFVLGPLSEIRPDLILPGESKSVRELWELIH